MLHSKIGDGLIQHRELQHVMRACMEENGMQFSEDQVSDHSYHTIPTVIYIISSYIWPEN